MERVKFGVRIPMSDRIDYFDLNFESLVESVLKASENIQPRTYIRVNTLKISPSELRERLESRGFILRQIEWNPHFFEVISEPVAISKTVEHFLGYFLIQDLASSLPVLALDLKRGLLVLDGCAAPGAKTTYIAQLMHNDGMILAVEIDENRLKALRDNVRRMGCANVIGVSGDLRDIVDSILRQREEKFDRILLDVPCTGLGIISKDRGIYREIVKLGLNAFRRKVELMSIFQSELLYRTARLLKPGGILVYSTCSLTFEENEGVVENFISRSPEFRITDIELPIGHIAGIVRYEGRVHHPDLKKCWRIGYETFNSTGFFLCKLVKGN